MRFKTGMAALPMVVAVILCAGPGSALGEESSGDTAQARSLRWSGELSGMYGFLPRLYNRVDGLVMGWGVTLKGKEEIRDPGGKITLSVPSARYPELHFELNQASARGFLGGRIDFKHRIAEKTPTDLGFSLRAGSATADSWRLTEPGSGLVYLVSGNDRFYWHDLRGGELFVRRSYPGGLVLQAGFFLEHVRSLGPRPVWTLVSSTVLRDNPQVVHGSGKGLRCAVGLDRRSGEDFFPDGWDLFLNLEQAGGPFGGDFDYLLLDLTVHRFFYFGELNYLWTGLKAVSARKGLPPHRLLSLGARLRGLDTFDPDFDFFDRRGDRMWLLSASYQRRLTEPPPLLGKLTYDWSLDLVCDSGLTFISDNSNDPLNLFDSLGHLKTSLGLGTSFTVHLTRVGIFLVKNLNRNHPGPLVTVDFGRPL